MTLRIIAGQFKGRLLKTPKSSSTRPTQGMLREAVFNICQNQIEGAHFLDLYAGSGAMAFEAISRGASHATLIEKNRIAAGCIKENMANLKVEDKIELIIADVGSVLKKLTTLFDIIYIDPPYDTVLEPLAEQLIKAHLMKEGALLFVEMRSTNSEKFQLKDLTWKSSRRFGSALLHQYQFGTPPAFEG
jgi:16S rRNA (guanine966-N2)-methyltransferase